MAKVYVLMTKSECTDCGIGERVYGAWASPELVIDAHPDGAWTEHNKPEQGVRYWTKDGGWFLEEWEVEGLGEAQ
jgi:hypothetical protein